MEVSCTRITILISRLAHSLLLLPPSVNPPPLNAYMDPNPLRPTATDPAPPPPDPLPRPPPSPYEYGHKLCTCEHTCRKIHPGGAWILTSTKRSHESKTLFMNSPYYWRGRGAGSTTATEFRERWRAARRARGHLGGHGSTDVSARMANLRRARGGHGHGHEHGRARGTVRTRDSDAALPTQASDNAVASSSRSTLPAGSDGSERIYAHGTVAPVQERQSVMPETPDGELSSCVLDARKREHMVVHQAFKPDDTHENAFEEA
ncbi:hypothetical protein K466DRAFT_116620 [Polyporus arcularius HHB13444]|uniref:Uncharacterized protein n=1 Tax=Polyporus arcularius HHB13444 TaxID=1314778 RepID=A0A5C3PGG9_9APHY|nr:hypothetical protein K466DRAFT_116620 [Polyporus arcularius HHB13444]